jgi:hypothetical protein
MKRLAGIISAAALVLTVGCAQTDSGITTSVKSRMAADDVVKANEIDVDTSNHVVTLSGDVDSMAAKQRAVQIASTTDGVRDVVDRLTVGETEATSGRIDIDSPDVNLGDDARRGGEIVKEGAEETGEAIKEGATAVKEGAEKLGSKAVDAVTDDDRDSDRDGK